MSSPNLKPFTNGATWVRADFHLHTIKEPGASRKGYRQEFRNRENEFPGEFIARLVEQEVKVAVLTNHNHFDLGEYKCLRKRAAKEGILILPGMELGVKQGGGGIHTLITFDPDEWLTNGEDRINRFLNTQFSETPNEGNRTTKDLCGVLSDLESYKADYFIVFAHVQTDNGFCQEIDWGMVPEVIADCGKLWSERVLGFQKVLNPEPFDIHWPSQHRLPAFVNGSDPKIFAEVATQNQNSYLKIGEPTFESVKFALLDYPQRVANGERPFEFQTPRLEEISFTGGRFDGKTFPLSDQLTCLIGSRGSGKSSVIECLRYALGEEVGKDDEKYKNGLISAVLNGGGEVTVRGTSQDGSRFEIIRALDYTPRVVLEGTETKLRTQDIFPGILYFGQKDLGNRHEGFEEEFFEKLIGPPSIEDRAKEEDLIAKIKRQVEAWQNILNAKHKEQGHADEAARLRDQLQIYKKHGVEKQLEHLTVFDSDKRNLRNLIEKLEELRSDLDRDQEDWKDLASDWPALKSPALSPLAKTLTKALEKFRTVAKSHQSFLQLFDELLGDLRQTQEGIQETESSLQKEFAELQREIDAPVGLDLQTFRKQKARLDQLQKLLKASKNTEGAAAAALEDVERQANQLHDLWRSQHRAEVAAIEEKSADLPESLKLSLVQEGDREGFQELISRMVSGQRVRRNSIDTVADRFSNGLVFFQGRKQLDKLLGGTSDVQKLRKTMRESLGELLTYRVKDKREIRFDGISIQNLSLGQRATALLQLLMAVKGHPLFIIDQPEDDLDNETIFGSVVGPLLQKKKTSQFIIATHNPNIPVLGDAELVHATKLDSKGQGRITSGSLDSSVTRDAIVSIMEGGKEAFEKRQQVYSQWTNSL